MFLAHPSGWDEKINKELDFFNSQQIQTLISKHFIIIDNFLEIDRFRALRKELEYLELSGMFSDVLQ